MYLPIILFFISLSCIAYMTGKKISLLRAGEVVTSGVGESLFKPPSMGNLKHSAASVVKKYGRIFLIVFFRLYIKFINFMKRRYADLKSFIVRKMNSAEGQSDADMSSPQEASTFLKMITEYKHKIRNIKYKIKEEEEENS